jgi:hypothetical protein
LTLQPARQDRPYRHIRQAEHTDRCKSHWQPKDEKGRIKMLRKHWTLVALVGLFGFDGERFDGTAKSRQRIVASRNWRASHGRAIAADLLVSYAAKFV